VTLTKAPAGETSSGSRPFAEAVTSADRFSDQTDINGTHIFLRYRTYTVYVSPVTQVGTRRHGSGPSETGVSMLAIVAAVIFGLALLLDLANINAGDALNYPTLLMAGLLFAALHLAGVGAGWRTRR
jgi:hypothetical protein